MGCKDAMVSLNWVIVGLRWEHSTGKVKQVSRHTDKVISCGVNQEQEVPK